MQRLEFKKKYKLIPPEYEGDVDNIVRAFEAHGYEVSDIDAFRAWGAHCESMFSAWITPDGNSDSIVRNAIVHLREA